MILRSLLMFALIMGMSGLYFACSWLVTRLLSRAGLPVDDMECMLLTVAIGVLFLLTAMLAVIPLMEG
ncbi:hypothetical protein [Bifidobacterium biavatii]|uniref:Uncharacterized protein n=1 Tax=Bifidobacterium biavatii DSM 23969 TaxID=1437608 RepID=A0A086ZD95_9BIFI|nr:hypothetical protein [Bifidobacterium biavatii]KFI44495.1 hypothetical protein BBIA_2403 [Bifidobacterium biavatii DSM 23969]